MSEKYPNLLLNEKYPKFFSELVISMKALWQVSNQAY